MTNDLNHPISIGKKIERLRRIRGIKQEALADALGVTRQYISKLEQSEEIEDERLEQIATALGVTTETIKNFNEEATFNYIQNNYEGSSSNYSGLVNCTFNPLDKLMELVEENRSLYQQLVQTEREKNAILESLLHKVK